LRTAEAAVRPADARPFWIIELGSSYEYAAVGAPGRDSLWILSRTPALDSQIYDRLVGRLRDQGYEVDRLVRTLQPGG
jgi:apolipoprotein D and lipocalin family protein